jgi:DNA polymerase III epsilon subunit-like protein
MNVTFDLETLGNTSQAPIVQIAAVLFDNQGNILKSIDLKADLETLPQGFVVDFSTLKWWFEQDDRAIKSVMTTGTLGHKVMCKEFMKWVQEIKKEYGKNISYWSHATFDPPILANNFKVAGVYNPIPFRAHRDIRTLTHFAGHIEVERKGIHHNAIDDCLFQAEYISKGIEKVEMKQFYRTDWSLLEDPNLLKEDKNADIR